MNNKNVKFAFGLILVFAAIVIGIWGRFAHFHSTEMEALFYGWKYWLGATVCGISGLYLIEIGK